MVPEVVHPVQVGAILRQYRVRERMSQETLAILTGLDRSFIGLVERGKRRPTLHTVSLILAVLEISWTEMGAALDQAGQEVPQSANEAAPSPLVRKKVSRSS